MCAVHDDLKPGQGIDRASPAHPRPDTFSLRFVRHASLRLPVNGQAPRVPRVVVQAGRVLALRAAGRTSPALPSHDSQPQGRGQGCALPALLSERHGPFRKQSRKVRPLAERGKDPTAVAEKETTMLAETKLTYVCAACSHRFDASEQPWQCPKCRAVGKARDFPTVETATIANQNDQLRLGLLGGMPKGMKAQVLVTPGINAKGPAFVSLCLLSISMFKDFSEDNDPWGDRGFAALTVDDTRIYFKIDLYDEACEYGSSEPANLDRTTRVMTVLLPSEY